MAWVKDVGGETIANCPTTTINDLPDELLLHIFSNLNSIRSYKPQSTAYQHIDNENQRQSENCIRQRTLHSLCLTCHRVRHIATPFLYASFLGSANWHGLEPLKLFHRTISAPAYASGLNVQLSECVQYIENRLSDTFGNSLVEDVASEGYDAIHMVARYFYLLADTVRRTPNLQHLSVVSLETDDVSFWKHLLAGSFDGSGAITSEKNASHGLFKLQTLCLQINTCASNTRPEAAWSRIWSAMTSIPLLADFQASTFITNGPYTTPNNSPNLLQRLELTHCGLEFDEVADMLSVCKGLRHFLCAWDYLDGMDDAPSDLYPGLLSHAETLETLCLDMREVRFDFSTIIAPPLLGTLRPFMRLKSLIICESALSGSTHHLLPDLNSPDHMLRSRLADMLPVGLSKLMLLLHNEDCLEFDDIDGVAAALWHLLEGCKVEVTELTCIVVRGYVLLNDPKLETAFHRAGIDLDFVREHPLTGYEV